MKAFFMAYFDAREVLEYHNPRTGLHSWMLYFTEGSTKIELMSWPDIEPHHQDLHAQGYVHLSISVGSRTAVDNLTDRLAADGYACLNGARVTGDGYYESCIVGPEGIIIEITV